MLVVLYHSGFSVPNTLAFQGGFVGVDVFFVISGFVVGGVLLRELKQAGRVSLGAFLIRRAARLLPALGVVVVVTLVLSFFLIPINTVATVAWTGVGASLLFANLILFIESGNYFGGDAELNPLLHTWSLSLEEQFYFGLVAIFAVSMFLSRRCRISSKRALGGAVIGAFVISLTYSFVEVAINPSLAFFSPLARAWEFLIGVILYMAHNRIAYSSAVRRLRPLLFLAGLAAVLYAAFFYTPSSVFPGPGALLPVFGTVAMIVAGTGGRVPIIHHLTSNPIVVAIGNLSYSWYLWHWPLIVLSGFVWGRSDEVALLAAFGALLPAWFSHRFIESWRFSSFRNPKKTLVQVLATSAVIPLVFAVGLVGAESWGFKKLAEEEPFFGVIELNKASTGAALGRLTAPERNPDVFVVGDSHAAILARGIAESEKAHGLAVESYTQGDCLFLSGPSTGTSPNDCKQWQSDTLQEIRASGASTVVLHGYATGTLSGFKRGSPSGLEIYSAEGVRADTLEQAQFLYQQGLADAVNKLVALGKTVLIITSVPDFMRPLVSSQAPISPVLFDVAIGNVPTFGESSQELIPSAEALARNRPFFDIEIKVAAEHPNAYVFDLTNHICQNGVCSQWRDGKLLYWDFDHVTRDHAEYLGALTASEILRNRP